LDLLPKDALEKILDRITRQKRDVEIAEYGLTDSIKDAVIGKILDVIRGQLTEENVERLVDFIKEKIDGGDLVDTVIDFLGDLVTQDVLDSVIDFIESKLLGEQGIAVYGLEDTAQDAILKALAKILDLLPDSVLDKIYERVCPGCPL